MSATLKKKKETFAQDGLNRTICKNKKRIDGHFGVIFFVCLD